MRRRHQRLDFAGTLHFVTTVTRERGPWFVHADTCEFTLSLLEKYRSRYEVDCIGYVLMPDHLHVLFYQEKEGSLVSDVMANFKRETSKQLDLPNYAGATLWCDRYDDIPLPGSRAIYRRLEYMHNNPVERGLVDKETDYLWSSARLYYEMDGQRIVTIRRP